MFAAGAIAGAIAVAAVGDGSVDLALIILSFSAIIP